LVERLERSGDSLLVADVSAMVADLFGSTSKFIRFLLRFLPPAREPRPSPFAQVPWSKRKMEKALSMVYDYRSKALHAGMPMPHPMMWPPSRDSDGGPYWERFPALAFGSAGAQWAADDIPMVLHVFEYIVRGALRTWWVEMIAASRQPGLNVE
jgi:hypothetical protein